MRYLLYPLVLASSCLALPFELPQLLSSDRKTGLSDLQEANQVPIGASGDMISEGQNRIIELKHGLRRLMSESQIHELMAMGQNFMDITGHPNLPVAQPELAQQSPFPTEATQHKIIDDLQGKIDRRSLFDNLFKLSSFWTRFCKSHTGLKSSLWVAEHLTNLTKDTKYASVRIVDHKDWIQKSVIVRLEGSEKPDDVVVIGAHLDSINLGDYYNGRAPGADDNGSGTVTLFETLRLILESGFRPKNTVEFHWYSAEEIGLLGSLDVFAEYAAANITVKAMLEQDMTGGINRYQGEEPSKIRLVTDNVSPILTKFLQLLVTEYTDLDYTLFQCGYACSDFYAAHIHGYHAAFATERGTGTVEYPGFPRIGHNEIDTIDRIDFHHMTQHVKLALSYVVELGLADL